MPRLIALLTIPLLALVLAGCSRAANTPETTPPVTETPQPEEPTVEEQLRGTWKTVNPCWEGNHEEHGPIVDTCYLTFTKSRYIWTRTRYKSSGEFIHQWADSGAWRVEGDQIIRVYLRDDVKREIAKDFQVGPDKLSITRFERREPTNEFEMYERVSAPSIVGSWVLQGTEFPDSLTVVEGGSVRFVWFNSDGWSFVYTASSWVLDEQEYAIIFPFVTFQRFDDDGKLVDPPVEMSYKRFAFAPTDQGGIVVSDFWAEHQSIRRPYGDYRYYFKRAAE